MSHCLKTGTPPLPLEDPPGLAAPPGLLPPPFFLPPAANTPGVFPLSGSRRRSSTSIFDQSQVASDFKSSATSFSHSFCEVPDFSSSSFSAASFTTSISSSLSGSASCFFLLAAQRSSRRRSDSAAACRRSKPLRRSRSSGSFSGSTLPVELCGPLHGKVSPTGAGLMKARFVAASQPSKNCVMTVCAVGQYGGSSFLSLS
mmetsp:Transcript_12237/g.28041  ORF Transcript_12237/g.28041 Transcript_12237/m.28041 type:complete len:201 (-) Transcript_12237:826-1428(-)